MSRGIRPATLLLTIGDDMQITLDDNFIEELGQELEIFKIRRTGYRSGVKIDLTRYKSQEISKLRDAIEKTGTRKLRVKRALAAIDAHLEIVERSASTVEAKNCETMRTILEAYVATQVPRQIVYMQQGGLFYPMYVHSVVYHPETRERDYTHPEKLEIALLYTAFGHRYKHSITFTTQQCKCNPKDLLQSVNIFPETNILRSNYEEQLARYQSLCVDIGRQCIFSGYACTTYRGENNDAIPIGGHCDSKFVGHLKPHYVVVDVINDSSDGYTEQEPEDRHTIDTMPWVLRRMKLLASKSNIMSKQVAKEIRESPIFQVAQDLDLHDIEDLTDEDLAVLFDKAERCIQVQAKPRTGKKKQQASDRVISAHEVLPIHPIIPVFDLTSYEFYTANVEDLTEYEYSTDLDSKLVVSDEVKQLIHTLAKSENTVFEDIVRDKSGGVNVLLAGPPGVGKTLTAEVYSETVARPLYRVHCAQLGIEPEQIEESLWDVFRRAKRWNAIVLLDEADVYTRDRGTDINANAIVGVFLRLLEYHECVLFLTTNIPESVDDAIASRCIARIDYKRPDDPVVLTRIWKTLTEASGVDIPDSVIKKLVAAYPHMSGRDVKNTLKLCQAHGSKVSFETIKMLLDFHPNRGLWHVESASKT